MIYLLFALIMAIIAGVCVVFHRRINGMYDLMARLLIDVFELEAKLNKAPPPAEEAPQMDEEEKRKADEAAKQFSEGVANILAYDFEKIMKRGEPSDE